MTRRLLPTLAGSFLCALALAAAAQAASPTSLLLSQSTAFSYLGRSCGGIQEQAYATGFASAGTGVTGDVLLQTRCGGSGRGGGYHSTTYSTWVAVSWDFAGKAVSTALARPAPAVNPAFSAHDAAGDAVYNQSGRAYLVVIAAAAPTAVNVAASGGQYAVSWTPDPRSAAVITSSTVTATPVASGPPVVISTAAGSASSTVIGPLQPQTSYQITVVSNDAGGSSPPSAAVALTTGVSASPPAAPPGVSGRFTAPGYPNDPLAVNWQAAAPGDSPTDEYQIVVSGRDGGGTLTQTVPGSSLSTSFAASDSTDWTIQVRAHDAAGWGPWSAPAFASGPQS